MPTQIIPQHPSKTAFRHLRENCSLRKLHEVRKRSLRKLHCAKAKPAHTKGGGEATTFPFQDFEMSWRIQRCPASCGPRASSLRLWAEPPANANGAKAASASRGRKALRLASKPKPSRICPQAWATWDSGQKGPSRNLGLGRQANHAARRRALTEASMALLRSRHLGVCRVEPRRRGQSRRRRVPWGLRLSSALLAGEGPTLHCFPGARQKLQSRKQKKRGLRSGLQSCRLEAPKAF